MTPVPTLKRPCLTLFLPVLAFGMSGCAGNAPLATVDAVDLQRFMGAWYVHAYTPLLVDHNAVNPVEHYHLRPDGVIATTYQFRKGSADGRLRTFTPRGTVHDTATNAEWRMQFVWPFKAPYLIVGLDEDYGGTVIGHPNRKYLWIMHRSSEVDPARLQRHLDLARELGFDLDRVVSARHDWDAEPERRAYLEALPHGAPFTYR